MDVWKGGIDLVARIYLVAKSFPKEEEFGLKSQIRRSAVSIPSNIAEGCSRNSDKEFRRFVEISLGSAFEVETQLIIADQLKIISEDESRSLINLLHIQQRRMNALITTLKKRLLLTAYRNSIIRNHLS